MLMDRLNPIDKQVIRFNLILNIKIQLIILNLKNFNFDLRDINWFNYVENYSIGCKQHLMKEDLERLPNCRKRLNKYLFLIILIFFIVKLKILFQIE